MCNLCNNSVLKVIRFDTKNNFVFCALQSEIGREIIRDLKIDLLKMDSILLYESPNNYTYKATAVLKIMNAFGWMVEFDTNLLDCSPIFKKFDL